MRESEFQYDVFVSYSHRDKEEVKRFVSRLKNFGLKVWIDYDKVAPGDHFATTINAGLENSRTAVLCWSKQAGRSQWCQFEAAAKLCRDPINSQRRLIPITLDGTPLKGPMLESLWQLDWSVKRDRSRVLSQIVSCCRPLLRPDFELPGHRSPITTLRWTGDGRALLSASYDGTVKLWKVFGDNGSIAKSVNSVDVMSLDDRILTIAVRKDGRVAAATRSGRIGVQNIRQTSSRGSKSTLIVGKSDSSSSLSLTWLASGLLISADDDGYVRIYDDHGKKKKEFHLHRERVRTLVVFEEHQLAVSGSHDRSLIVFDLLDGKKRFVLEDAHGDDINSLCKTGELAFASAGDDGMIKTWSLSSDGKLLRQDEARAHNNYIIELSHSRCGAVLAAKSGRRVSIWDTQTLNQLAEIDEPMEVVWPVGLAFNHRFDYLATLGDFGRTIRLWPWSRK